MTRSVPLTVEMSVSALWRDRTMLPVCAPSIVCLLLWGSPPAILRTVRTLIINSIQRVTRRWFWSHIFKERTWVINPPLADGNATTAITKPLSSIAIQASLLHGVIRNQFTRRLTSWRLPMGNAGSGGALFLKTPTTPCIFSETPRSNNNFSATVASALPQSLPLVPAASFVENHKTPKPVASTEIIDFRHVNTFIQIRV